MTRLLQNPSGPYSAYFARRDLTIRNLEERFHKIMKDAKDFKYEIFKNKNDFIFYFKIPSETYEKLFYDVVLQFSPISEQSVSDLSLNNYSVKLFSNAPNFLFTYAYVYNQDGILIDFLKKKISEKALNEPPNIKNPIQSYGFEKSVYFALLYIKIHRLNIKSAILSKSKKLDVKDLVKAVDDTDEKLKQYNRAKAKEKEKSSNKKVVAKSQKKGYNEDVAERNGKATPRLQMKRDMSLKESNSNGKKTKTTLEKKRNMKHNMSVKKKKK
jgi:hypothetical protein